MPWSKSRTAVFKISKISTDPSFRNGISAGASKTLLILRFLATGAEETNESDFEEAGFSIISSCRLEVKLGTVRVKTENRTEPKLISVPVPVRVKEPKTEPNRRFNPKCI